MTQRLKDNVAIVTGAAQGMGLAEIQEKNWDLVMNVNLKVLLFCQAVISEMVIISGGAIVNISALAAPWHASLAGFQYVAA